MGDRREEKTGRSRAGRRSLLRWTAAAVVAVLMTTGGVFLYHREKPPQKKQSITKNTEKGIAPGGNKAVLVLSNGAKILLDSAAEGLIAQQGKAKVVKSDSGQIAYDPASTDTLGAVFNEIRIPKGGTYRIVLADGTKVWLNAASTLRFPTSFPGRERKVKMDGEAYFEVAENRGKPFIVEVDGMEVQVLGTKFNIMTYDNEPATQTTLLEGKVRVKMNTGPSVLLKSGEQVQVDKSGEIQPVEKVDVNKVIAWKNNLFWFERNDIQEVMRQIARWYDVDVEIKGEIPQHFTGSIPRDVNVLRVFQVLQETGNIHFKVEKNKIIVSA